MSAAGRAEGEHPAGERPGSGRPPGARVLVLLVGTGLATAIAIYGLLRW